ncbi:hypothetical protein BDZ94DRAFT_1222813 [Collybia nuda]|uniref:Uncharacterized protein n=1 Tax=Collybia nuda TaxID=64659 RepID=A0A9P6CCF6_9AGAR|nr:hypothetical protein BDZ94DRAFT_1222813 [Collybia nuda]
MIIAYMKQHSGKVVLGASVALSKISSEDLQRRVVEKFTSLQKGLRDGGYLNSRNERVVVKAANVSHPIEEGQPETSGGVTIQIKLEEKAKRAKIAILASRATGKLEVRMRKRENLPLNSQYRDTKYDAAFTKKLMLDDEDEFDANGIKTANFVLHAPAYRSKELKELFAAVDAVLDPDASARYTRHVIGPVCDEPPRVAKKLELKARRWMIDPDWLAKEDNQKYDVESRIVDSGKAWGDNEDPEVLLAKREKLKAEKKTIAEGKKRKMMEAAVEKWKKKAKTNKGRKGVKTNKAQGGPSTVHEDDGDDDGSD